LERKPALLESVASCAKCRCLFVRHYPGATVGSPSVCLSSDPSDRPVLFPTHGYSVAATHRVVRQRTRTVGNGKPALFRVCWVLVLFLVVLAYKHGLTLCVTRGKRPCSLLASFSLICLLTSTLGFFPSPERRAFSPRQKGELFPLARKASFFPSPERRAFAPRCSAAARALSGPLLCTTLSLEGGHSSAVASLRTSEAFLSWKADQARHTEYAPGPYTVLCRVREGGPACLEARHSPHRQTKPAERTRRPAPMCADAPKALAQKSGCFGRKKRRCRPHFVRTLFARRKQLALVLA